MDREMKTEGVWTEKENKKSPRHTELVCYRCGERGHMCRNCRSKVTECKNCERKGHREEDCWEKNIICCKCQKMGHKESRKSDELVNKSGIQKSET